MKVPVFSLYPSRASLYETGISCFLRSRTSGVFPSCFPSIKTSAPSGVVLNSICAVSITTGAIFPKTIFREISEMYSFGADGRKK
jgi:hypothetical protein